MMSCSLIAGLSVSGATKNVGTRPDVMMIGLLCDNWPVALNF